MTIDLLEELLSPIKGSRLSSVFEQYAKHLFPTPVFDSPATAMQAIEHYFGGRPSIEGSNNIGISNIREALSQCCTIKSHIQGFRINAPHTHWGDLKPIIYQFEPDDERYIIGPHIIENDSIYLPISFAFNDNHPLAFEWIELNEIIDVKEFYKCIEVIKIVNTSLAHKKFPLGISIDFFFKKSLFDNSITTVELPCDESNAEINDFSYIIKHSVFLSQEDLPETEQVSWSSNSSSPLELTTDERALLYELRQIIEQASGQNNKAKIIYDIESKLEQRRE